MLKLNGCPPPNNDRFHLWPFGVIVKHDNTSKQPGSSFAHIFVSRAIFPSPESHAFIGVQFSVYASISPALLRLVK